MHCADWAHSEWEDVDEGKQINACHWVLYSFVILLFSNEHFILKKNKNCLIVDVDGSICLNYEEIPASLGKC